MSVLERWPGYDEQSWQERFAELDRQYGKLLVSATQAIIAVAPKSKPTPPERAKALEEAAFRRGVEHAALIADRYWSSNLNPASLPEAIRALSASPIEVDGGLVADAADLQ